MIMTSFTYIMDGKALRSESVTATNLFIPRRKDEVFLKNECYVIQRVIHKFTNKHHDVFFTVSKSTSNSASENKIIKGDD